MEELTTREKILQEAEKQFIDRGIQNTQMKEIAEAVKINRRTLYRYFPTKEELAFEVELVVMDKLQFNPEMDESRNHKLTGFEKIKLYFDEVNLDGIRDLLKFTAEFDRYFQDEYPGRELEELFISKLDPGNDILYVYIKEGCEDGSLRNDLTAHEIFTFISQNFLGFFQRLIIREKHLVHEHCDNVDFQKLFRKIVLSGIKAEP
ncbi:TetR/AcrR family transcriptional regulator [Spirochaeta isovalerica]|uniref:AcrR family transcriptional regulator n=1 Tax=Spirochaeta isovalerica TaxID=150 RepID=A0A841R6H7_9SPIO|nr:helix-turn-helix domain-containing protein [Spirochaeta isovalerica]MBB6479455.1 AcrR family transcriptional regulator [Spirochaeta isovalerica]